MPKYSSCFQTKQDSHCRRLPSTTPSNFNAVVRSYIKQHREIAKRQLDVFKSMGSITVAIGGAAWAGKADHQRRIPRSTLKRFTDNLMAKKSQLRGCSSFKILHDLVKEERVKGIGELTVYDTSLRLGSYLNLLPRRVYLHRGTREGAKSLSRLRHLNYRAESIPLSKLDRAFRKLHAYEAEDCLCIYKEAIKRIAASRERR